MKLFTKCKYCKEDIDVKSSARTRPEFRSEVGLTTKVICTKCNQTTERHVNEIRARVNTDIVVYGALTGIALTGILFFFLGAIAVVTFLIPLLVYQSQMSNVNSFNSYLVRSYPDQKK